jgi:hypothetical protein
MNNNNGLPQVDRYPTMPGCKKPKGSHVIEPFVDPEKELMVININEAAWLITPAMAAKQRAELGAARPSPPPPPPPPPAFNMDKILKKCDIVKLEPGDVVLFTLPHELPDSELESMRHTIDDVFGSEIKGLILDHNIKTSVLRKK